MSQVKESKNNTKKQTNKKQVTKQNGQCKLYFVKMSNTYAMRSPVI